MNEAAGGRHCSAGAAAAANIPPTKLSKTEAASLAALAVLAFADVFTYSGPDTFLGVALADQGASTGQVMVAYGMVGAASAVTGILVLLCQSNTFIASIKLSSKWLLMLSAQSIATAAAAVTAVWPTLTVITASRAAHGVAAVVFITYCLVVLMEVSPKHHLGLGIALVTAGMTAGDAIAPVLGAVVFDKGGLRAACSMIAAVNLLALVALGLPVILSLKVEREAARRGQLASVDLGAARKESGLIDLAAVFSTLKDPVIFSQCFFLLLEQMMTCALTVVLPAAMATPTWMVGVVYISNVVGALMAPFALDKLLVWRPTTPTHVLSAWLSAIMGTTTALCVLASGSIPALSVLLFLFGASQSAVEALVYIHVAQRLAEIGSHRVSATPVSMCMFYLAQTGGGGLGSLTGGALQQQMRGVQQGVMAAGAGITALYGMVLGIISNKKIET
eukprot:gene8877-9055_t